jgi:hypothetical protein
MRGAVYFGAAAVVVGAAFWTYRVNYDATEALVRVETLRQQITAQREALVVLRAEWAWLNAPERLAALNASHAEALALQPMAGTHFYDLAALPSPPPETFWVRVDPALLAPQADTPVSSAERAALAP